MKRYRVILTRNAEVQLDEIETYITAEASRPIARRFVDGIIAKCDALEYFPSRGTPRGDLGIGLRTVPYLRRTTILYSVEDDTVAIHGIFYGGQDWESWFRSDH